MIFHLDGDSGHTVNGWVVLDNPGETPWLSISRPGLEDLLLKANVFRKDLYDLGIHGTGLAGFHIDEAIIPGLSNHSALVIKECGSGLPIHGRVIDGIHLERRIAIIDVGILPHFLTFKSVFRHFALQYPMLDRVSLETIGAILSKPNCPSVVASGNINWARSGGIIEDGQFLSMTLLRDPFEDLAEKLFVLKKLVARDKVSSSFEHVLQKYGDLLPLVEKVDLESSKSIVSGMRVLTRDQRRLLRSPMTYTFGAAPDEELQRRNVSIALDNLAKLDLVGVSSRADEFFDLANELLGAEIFLRDDTSSLSVVAELAECLSEVGIVCDLLDEDIALYSFVNEAISSAHNSGASQNIKAVKLG